MYPPQSRRPARHFLLGLATLLLVLITAIPSAFSLHSAGAAASVGATGNDSRAFPKTFHVWGGAPNSYTKYDLVIGYPAWDIASLRAANPGAIYLANPQLDPFNSDWQLRKGTAVTYGAANSFAGATDGVVDGSAANLGTIPAWNTYWDTLHRPDGTVAPVNSDYGHPGWNLTRPDTAEKVAEIMAYGAKLSKVYRNGWDGIWSDNWIYRIGASWFYGSNLDTNRDGQADDMGTVSRQWWDGLTLAGQRLRSHLPGKIVGGNGAHNIAGLTGGTDPSGPYKTSNITMNEVLQLYTTRPEVIISEVQSYLGFADPLGMPRYFLLMHDLPGGQSDYRSMRWGFSLATIAGAYYEPYASSHSDAFSYDEFTGGTGVDKRGWLGEPAFAPTKLSNGVWRRDFQNGVVLNNSTSAAQIVSLGGTYQRLKGSQDATVNSGASVTSVTIGGGDGLFLRGSAGTTTSVPQNTTAPAISGSPVVGQVLSASPGTWSGSPTYAYQWQRCDASTASCADVVGAKSSSYALAELDTGWRMRVKITGTNAFGSSTAVSAATATVDDPFSVTQSIVENATLSSTVTWTASPEGKTVSKVDFTVDGKVVATDVSAPYSTTLQTTSLTNGSHRFAVTATATDGAAATASANATVSNEASTFQVAQNLTDGQTVSGSLVWSATASGKTVAKVEFVVDGAVVAADSAAPYEVTLDTKRFADGTHVFAARVSTTDGTTASVSASVVVSNAASQAFSVSQNVTPDQVVSGVVDWIAEPTGKPVRRVEFTVDGAKVATMPNAPYRTSVDTLKLADGTHGFGVIAYASSGETARSYALVRVANRTAPPPSPTASLSVSQNITSGQTLSGFESWTASPAGKTVARVEFFVDDRLSWTENYAPYVYAGDGNRLDTSVLGDGSHTLSVKAYATDGSIATATATVVVSNAVASVTLASSIKDGSTITGQVSWTITPSGKPVSRMEFYIDSQLKWTERLSPWVYGGDDRKLDTSTLSRGQHTLVVKAYITDGTVVSLTLEVTVA
ncbi:MAG: Ig-like domain-containing protein [Actinomycetota bacterium]|nr:Ig-like domain-containing protein [Actinomycetota bacterium]